MWFRFLVACLAVCSIELYTTEGKFLDLGSIALANVVSGYGSSYLSIPDSAAGIGT